MKFLHSFDSEKKNPTPSQQFSRTREQSGSMPHLHFALKKKKKKGQLWRKNFTRAQHPAEASPPFLPKPRLCPSPSSTWGWRSASEGHPLWSLLLGQTPAAVPGLFPLARSPQEPWRGAGFEWPRLPHVAPASAEQCELSHRKPRASHLLPRALLVPFQLGSFSMRKCPGKASLRGGGAFVWDALNPSRGFSFPRRQRKAPGSCFSPHPALYGHREANE